MRRAARKDGNQSKIERALKRRHITYTDTSTFGNGFPDLVVGYDSQNYLFEVKDPDQPPSKRMLTPAEQTFHQSWRGQVAVIETVEDVLRVIFDK